MLPDRSGWLLIGVLALLYSWNLGGAELSVTDEARSAVIVRDMAEDGRWLLPRTPDGYLCEKPLAYYMTCALLGKVFGINEWTLRGVSVAMGVATLILTWILARLYGPPRTAFVAVVALASNVFFIGCARDAMVDMTLACFITAGFTAYFAARTGKLSPWRAALLCGAAFGLATLSKGPLGIALPIAVLGGDALFEHRGRFWRALPLWKHGLVALLIAVALSCAWYVPGYLRGGREFLETSLLAENFRMPMGDAEHTAIGVSHRKPFFYYLGIQLAAVLTLLPLIPALFGWAKDRASDPARRHLAAWFLFGFLLFQLASNKRMYYLIPLQPAVAVMLGLAVERAIASPDRRLLSYGSWIAGPLILLGALGVLGICFKPDLLAGVREGTVTEALRDHRAGLIVGGIGLLGVGAALIAASRRGPEAVLRASCWLGGLAIAVRFGPVERVMAEFDRTRPFIAAAAPKLPPGVLPVVMPPIRGYTLDFYWPGRLVRSEKAAAEAPYLLVSRRMIDKIAPPFETLGVWKYGPAGRDDVLLIRRERPR